MYLAFIIDTTSGNIYKVGKFKYKEHSKLENLYLVNVKNYCNKHFPSSIEKVSRFEEIYGFEGKIVF
jgi:hypothetical protein